MPRRGLRWHVVSEAATAADHEGTLKRGSPCGDARAPWDQFECQSSGPPSLRTVLPVTGVATTEIVHAPGAEVSGSQQITASANQAGLMHYEEGVVAPLIQELAVEARRFPACELPEQDRIELAHHGFYLPSVT